MSEKTFSKPRFFYVGGDYYVNKLFDNGVSIIPDYSSVKEVDLKKIYGLTEKEISEIPGYADFILRPENRPEYYSREITLGDGVKYLNRYELPFHPEGKHQYDEAGINWPIILSFLLHIAPHVKPFHTSKFTYFELILDYLALAWRTPTCNLPLLVLVSKERSTGKTTFLELIQLMFQTNARWVNEKDLDSEFNRFWGFANFLLIDEAKVPKNLMNRIKSESTASLRGINEKYQTKSYTANFSKFVMTSNEIDNFAQIDPEENRFFIIEVPPLAPGTEDKNFKDKMQKELPNFLDYLMNHHQIQTGDDTRMTFNYDDYKTPALDKVVNGSQSSVYLKVEEALKELGEYSSQGVMSDYIWEFCLTNFRNYLGLDKGKERQLKDAFKKLGVQSTENKIRFKCAYQGYNEVHAIKYSITVGQLRTLFNMEENKVLAEAT